MVGIVSQRNEVTWKNKKEGAQGMNLEKAMRLPLVDGGIIKVIIGAILNIIPIVNFLCSGYFIEIMAKLP